MTSTFRRCRSTLTLPRPPRRRRQHFLPHRWHACPHSTVMAPPLLLLLPPLHHPPPEVTQPHLRRGTTDTATTAHPRAPRLTLRLTACSATESGNDSESWTRSASVSTLSSRGSAKESVSSNERGSGKGSRGSALAAVTASGSRQERGGQADHTMQQRLPRAQAPHPPTRADITATMSTAGAGRRSGGT